MKNLLLVLIMASAAIGCSEEGGGGAPAFVESHIFIDGQRFEPSPAANSVSYVTTTFEAGVVNGTANQRTFQLTESTGVASTDRSMTVVISYPSAENINGTYDFDPVEFDPANDAQASFSIGDDLYGFIDGSITIAELGSSRYRLTFTNAKIVNIASQNTEIPVTGYFEGVFSVE